MTVTQFDWTIPGTRVGGYTANMTTASVTALPALSVGGNKKKHDITIYWVLDFVDKDVMGVFTTDEGKFTAKSTFTVVRPTATLTATSGVRPIAHPLGAGQFAIGLFNLGVFGIEFTESATIAAQYSGITEFWQTVNSTTTTRTRITSVQLTPNGPLPDFTTDQAVLNNSLDGAFPYPALSGTGVVPTSSQTAADSPQHRGAAVSRLARVDSFSMHTMFKSDVMGSIWVPLRRLDWDWEIDVSIPWNVAQQPNGQINLTPGAPVYVTQTGPPANVTSVDQQSHPTWTQNVTSLTFQPVP